MKNLDTKLLQYKGRISKRILTIRLEEMKLEHKVLAEQYEKGEYYEDEYQDYEDEYQMYSMLNREAMARVNGAIDACYDI